MAWDLRTALLRKGENESARLDSFEFRLRARTMRRLAKHLGRSDGEALVRAVAQKDDASVLADLLALDPALDESQLNHACQRARAEVRTEMIQEFGDPAPHRLA